jgi:hypothetical protein
VGREIPARSASSLPVKAWPHERGDLDQIGGGNHATIYRSSRVVDKRACFGMRRTLNRRQAELLLRSWLTFISRELS